MGDEIDEICERIESADEKEAGEIFLSLTRAQMKEVIARLSERVRRRKKILDRIKRIAAAIDA